MTCQQCHLFSEDSTLFKCVGKFRRVQCPVLQDSEPHLRKLIADTRSLIEQDNRKPSEIAAALGVDRRRVDDWINRGVRPGPEAALALADLVRKQTRNRKRREAKQTRGSIPR